MGEGVGGGFGNDMWVEWVLDVGASAFFQFFSTIFNFTRIQRKSWGGSDFLAKIRGGLDFLAQIWARGRFLAKKSAGGQFLAKICWGKSKMTPAAKFDFFSKFWPKSFWVWEKSQISSLFGKPDKKKI